MKLIPGYRQDHKGRTYQIGISEDGPRKGMQVQVLVAPAPLSPITERELASIIITRPDGTTYKTMACYQGRNV